jgi:hypothetical protein
MNRVNDPLFVEAIINEGTARPRDIEMALRRREVGRAMSRGRSDDGADDHADPQAVVVWIGRDVSLKVHVETVEV